MHWGHHGDDPQRNSCVTARQRYLSAITLMLVLLPLALLLLRPVAANLMLPRCMIPSVRDKQRLACTTFESMPMP